MLPEAIARDPREHFTPTNCPGAGEGVILTISGAKKECLLGGLWESFLALFPFDPPGREKHGSGRAFKNNTQFCVDFGLCPKGLRRVPVHTGALFSLFGCVSKECIFWAPVWSNFGSPERTYSPFGGTWADVRPYCRLPFLSHIQHNLPKGLRHLSGFLQRGWELRALSGAPWGGQQEGQGRQTGMPRA